MVYIVIGIFASFASAFVLLYQGNLGIITNIRFGFGAVIAAYGLFRIYTGISMIRKANRFVSLEGKQDVQGRKDDLRTPTPLK